MPTVRQSIRPIAVLFAALFIVCAGNLHAQQDTGDAGGDAGGDTGRTPFEGVETDLSVFDSVERGDSVGTSTTQGFGLVGEQTGGAAGRGGAAGGGGGFGGGLGGLGGLLGGLGGAFGGQGASTQKPVIRVRLRSAINIPPRPAEVVQRSANRTLAFAPRNSGVRGVSVTMNGSTAVLSGTVATERDRRMSELLMKLEPGVRAVDNRVTVGQ